MEENLPANPAPDPAPLPEAPVPSESSSGSKSLLIIIAVVLVVLLAGAGAVWTYLSSSSSRPASPLAASSPAPSIAPQPPPLRLSSPAQGDLAVNREVIVRGITAPDITVTLVTDADAAIVQSDSQGNFEGTVLLTEGLNTLLVTAFTDEGAETSTSVDVVYDSPS